MQYHTPIVYASSSREPYRTCPMGNLQSIKNMVVDVCIYLTTHLLVFVIMDLSNGHTRQVKRIAIIGAGATGLVQLKNLLDVLSRPEVEYELEVVVFESKSEVGGVW